MTDNRNAWTADYAAEDERQADEKHKQQEDSERAAKRREKTRARQAAERERRRDELAAELGIKREAADTVLSSGLGKTHMFTLSEDSIARVFAHQFGDALRYSHDRGRWYRWDDTRWCEETTDAAFDFCRSLCRSLNLEGKRQWQKASVAAAVEKFARADRVFAMRGDEWDADPWLLNTPGGTVDLRTGAMRPARQADLITRSTSVAPEEGEPRLWRQFLGQITQGDEMLELFLRQIAGYALTGDTREESLFYVYGPGGNGKSTLIGALQEIWGDYSVNATMDAFLASRFERHSTDLAMLRGARLVIASETQQGRAWDEQRVKGLTGGDPITARFMRADNFTFRPAFKLLLYGNSKPVLKTVDDAWRRRFHIVPFTYKPATVDNTIKQRLRPEYGRILQWAIDGCLDWQRHGLSVPACVKRETEGYFELQDTFGAWLADKCEVGPYSDTSKGLFESWRTFCEEAGEHPGGQKAFADQLMERNFRRIKDEMGIRGRGFSGLRTLGSAANAYSAASNGD